jgi:hypothetical protein
MTSPAQEVPPDSSRSGLEETMGAAPEPASSPPDAEVMVVEADTVRDAPLAPVRSGADSSVDTAATEKWSEIQAMFVDDPRRSVAAAAGMVDEAISAFIEAAHERQASLASSWQGQQTDTEQLRLALQDYRAFWSSVADVPQPA